MDIIAILLDVVQKRASDVHITVGTSPMYRIKGSLVRSDFPKFTPSDSKDFVYGLMNEEQTRTLEEKGEVDFSFGQTHVGRFRANVFKQRGSYACSLRVVATGIPDARLLGIPNSVMDLAKKKNGLILVTGPTGSGKSTTLASIINLINNTRNEHIITLEDPIEYVHRHNKCIINQREIGLDSQSYASALRAALRQDPDVILVGEMRDLETISTAITAAETGHLVLSTLHTTGAVSTIDRIIDVFPPHQQQQIRVQLSMVLVSVISQILLKNKMGDGRSAAFEVMHTNAAIRNLIREGKSHQIKSILQTNKKTGMQTMDESLLNLLKDGRIDIDDAIMYASDRTAFERRLY